MTRDLGAGEEWRPWTDLIPGGSALHGRLGFGGTDTDDHEQIAVKVIRADLVPRDASPRGTEALRTVQGPHIASPVDARLRAIP
ncbi:hypothetical protein D0T12_28670 [Actinomadura spongiicola]|uniref:Uncharacterized protein n=1 Tax=Actinomadura spongiicola TaxID=2303421 RepID=A0A372GAN9_9ACTN|nr:hypothetical protein [Actinomadura spongiicola]RFS82212.1 hypothetical protein D0T12_28670 [Actinomadura spongiicola]